MQKLARRLKHLGAETAFSVAHSAGWEPEETGVSLLSGRYQHPDRAVHRAAV